MIFTLYPYDTFPSRRSKWYLHFVNEKNGILECFNVWFKASQLAVQIGLKS